MEAGIQHHTPHYHVYYQEHTCIYSIEPIEMIAGMIPKKQQRLVEAWAELHTLELREDWECLQKGELPQPIEPLK